VKGDRDTLQSAISNQQSAISNQQFALRAHEELP
jgi:hypothetical protein